MKDKHTVGGKWPEIAVNKPFIIVIRFDSDYTYTCGKKIFKTLPNVMHKISYIRNCERLKEDKFELLWVKRPLFY